MVELKIINYLIPSKKKTKIIKIKLSADGTRIGKKVKLINYCFSILNNKKTANSPLGHHTLGIASTEEKYEFYVDTFNYIMKEILSLKFINFNGKKIRIVYFLPLITNFYSKSMVYALLQAITLVYGAQLKRKIYI